MPLDGVAWLQANQVDSRAANPGVVLAEVSVVGRGRQLGAHSVPCVDDRVSRAEGVLACRRVAAEVDRVSEDNSEAAIGHDTRPIWLGALYLVREGGRRRRWRP